MPNLCARLCLWEEKSRADSAYTSIWYYHKFTSQRYSVFKKGYDTFCLGKKSNIANCPYTNNYDLFIEQKVNIGYYHERIGFSNLSTDKKGIFQIFSPNQLTCDSIVNVLASTADGDKVLNFYKPLRGQKNTITLTEYNKSTKEVSGTFDITLLIDFGTLDSRAIYPDTIRLYNCQFKTVIND